MKLHATIINSIFRQRKQDTDKPQCVFIDLMQINEYFPVNYHLLSFIFDSSAVIRQKDESQNGFSRTRKAVTCAYQWVRNVCFSENLVFLKHPF